MARAWSLAPPGWSSGGQRPDRLEPGELAGGVDAQGQRGPQERHELRELVVVGEEVDQADRRLRGGLPDPGEAFEEKGVAAGPEAGGEFSLDVDVRQGERRGRHGGIGGVGLLHGVSPVRRANPRSAVSPAGRGRHDVNAA
ncbi:hypothetical protein MKK68_02160 [Methylobacterium sp. E-016]|uniref:hypothetical protein n=1 Tax=Methylobacterium sp. E-016 TaxID=2836556 RepID=UPI001FBBDEF7|nr:hypothetical protein [Methylobacterium sp. E-016]MCJ2074465.1 hypothetical protein [Methylobacterium sp. E-016]